MQPAGDYPVSVALGEAPGVQSLATQQSVTSSIHVHPEHACVSSLKVQKSPLVAGPAGTAPVSVLGSIKQARDGWPGDLSMAVVHVKLVPRCGSKGKRYEQTVTGASIDHHGRFATTFPGVEPNDYEVSVWVGGGYFSAHRCEGPSLTVLRYKRGRTCARGWSYWPHAYEDEHERSESTCDHR